MIDYLQFSRVACRVLGVNLLMICLMLQQCSLDVYMSSIAQKDDKDSECREVQGTNKHATMLPKRRHIKTTSIKLRNSVCWACIGGMMGS
jgi:hypothetical protein